MPFIIIVPYVMSLDGNPIFRMIALSLFISVNRMQVLRQQSLWHMCKFNHHVVLMFPNILMRNLPTVGDYRVQVSSKARVPGLMLLHWENGFTPVLSGIRHKINMFFYESHDPIEMLIILVLVVRSRIPGEVDR